MLGNLLDISFVNFLDLETLGVLLCDSVESLLSIDLAILVDHLVNLTTLVFPLFGFLIFVLDILMFVLLEEKLLFEHFLLVLVLGGLVLGVGK